MNRALLLIAGWVGRGMALWLSSSRRPLAAELAALRERLAKLQAENDLLHARLERLEPHRRPRYAPWERLRILLHRARYGLSVETTARAFLVTDQTVLNWLEEVRQGVTRLVASRKPVNALSDLVREIAFLLKREWPGWGTRRIAGILARLGLKASRTSVQRILRTPLPRPAAPDRGRRPPPLCARRPGSVWVVDFTMLRGFFRSMVVGAVLDAFSRKVLALRVWEVEPDSARTCLLVQDALRDHGRPTWLLSDRGRQFRSARFRSMLERRGIRRRFAALGDANLSRIDRFWRAMKGEYGRGLVLYQRIPTLERRLRGYARWHGAERPHQGLDQQVPDDVHASRPQRRKRCLDRGVLEVSFIGGDRRLPIFRLRAAA